MGGAGKTVSWLAQEMGGAGKSVGWLAQGMDGAGKPCFSLKKTNFQGRFLN